MGLKLSQHRYQDFTNKTNCENNDRRSYIKMEIKQPHIKKIHCGKIKKENIDQILFEEHMFL